MKNVFFVATYYFLLFVCVCSRIDVAMTTFSDVHLKFVGETERGKPLDRARCCSKKNGYLPIFAKETLYGRSIIVTGYNKFFVRYMKDVQAKQRCYHEYIVGMCNLYIDIDAERFGNPQLYEDNKACDLILDMVYERLYERYKIKKERVDVVCLDSSNERKLSRHYIFNIRDENGYYTVAWRDSIQCGIFMNSIVARFNVTQYPGLYVTAGQKAYTKNCIIDRQVYGRNKSLRTYMSGKPKDPTRLLRTPQELDNRSTTPNLITFLHSLVCYFVGNEYKNMTQVLSMHEDVSRETKMVLNNAQLMELTLKKEHKSRYSKRKVSSSNDIPDEYLEVVKKTLKHSLYGMCYDKQTNSLRTWVDSKVCEIAGKKHSKNHVYYTFNFDKGIYYQGCLSENNGCVGKHGPIRNLIGYKTQKRRKTVPTKSVPLAPFFVWRKQCLQ